MNKLGGCDLAISGYTNFGPPRPLPPTPIIFANIRRGRIIRFLAVLGHSESILIFFKKRWGGEEGAGVQKFVYLEFTCDFLAKNGLI